MSILDTDWYKLTMQAAVLAKYPGLPVTYRYYDRKPRPADPGLLERVRFRIQSLRDLRLDEEEYAWLRTFDYLPAWYPAWLRSYRFDPDQVRISATADGLLDIRVVGPWEETILWEVPILAIVSEEMTMPDDMGTLNRGKLPHRYVGLSDKLAAKVRTLSKTRGGRPLRYADFGTRRRRSWQVQRYVVDYLTDKIGFVGTSNARLSYEMGTAPVGTMAHEWIMAAAVTEGLRHANRHALRSWAEVYRGRLGIALTDTYGSAAFWQDFVEFAHLYDGVRQDSGDPTEFVHAARAFYQSQGIDPRSKQLVFSDGLTSDRVAELDDLHGQDFAILYGIGTHLTNDFAGCYTPSIVLKLDTVQGIGVVKLSDDPGKETGDTTELMIAKRVFGL